MNAELKDALRGILESQRTSDRRDIETVDLEAENLAKRQQLAEVELAHLRQQVVLRQGELARITSRTAELREEVRLGEARRPTVSAELGSLESTLERANQDLGVGEEGRGDTMATLQEEVARLRVHKENVTDQVCEGVKDEVMQGVVWKKWSGLEKYSVVFTPECFIRPEQGRC